MRMMRMLGLVALIAAPLAAQQPSQPDTARPPMMGGGPGMMGRGMQGQMPMMGQGMMGGEMMGHMMQMMQMHQMMGPMMGPMMRAMGFDPEQLLDRKDALDLTPQQVTRLTAIRDAAKTAHDAAQSEGQTHMQEVARAMGAGAPDTNAMKTHFQAAQAAMSRAHWNMLSAAAQARAVLTDNQRGRVEGWTDAMMMQMGQMMQGMQGMTQMMPRMQRQRPDSQMHH